MKLAPGTIYYDVSVANDPVRTGIGRLTETILRGVVEVMEAGAWTAGPFACLSCWPHRFDASLRARLERQGVALVHVPFRSVIVWRAMVVPWWARSRRAGLVVLPEPIFSPLPFKPPFAAIVNDLSHLDEPTPGFRHVMVAYHAMFNPTMRGARSLTAISEFTRRRLVEVLPETAAKTCVLPMVSEMPRRGAEPPGTLPDGLPERFALFVGNLTPKKNIRALIAAFARWKDADPASFVPLVLVGKVRPEVDDVAPLVAQMRAAGVVAPAGYVTDAQLLTLYDRALFFAFPSLFEGYGLPILEAMARNCPVLTSRGGATEEAAGGAAHLVEPTNADDLFRGIRELGTDAGLRERLAAAGRARVEALTHRSLGEAFQRFIARALDSKTSSASARN